MLTMPIKHEVNFWNPLFFPIFIDIYTTLCNGLIQLNGGDFMKKKIVSFFLVVIFSMISLTGCGASTSGPDDYATNEGYDNVEVADANNGETPSEGIQKEDIKVGVLYLCDPAEGSGGIDAFAIGVASVNPDAKIYVVITNSWYDPEKEEAASRKLLDMGCDVMTQHCDTPYPMTLAKEYGVYGIGYNSDMSKEVPDTCLCSVIWNWSAYYTSAVESIIDGTWNGENYYGGMNEGLVGITDLASFCADGTQEKVSTATEEILNGTNGVFDGEFKTNTGEIIGSKGETLEDSTITGGIDWYYENVELVE